jgi:hypothetical protein
MSNKGIIEHLLKDHGYSFSEGSYPNINDLYARRSKINMDNHINQHKQKYNLNLRPLTHDHEQDHKH